MARQEINARTDPYEADLHPHNRSGENRGPEPENTRSAYDVKELHDIYRGLSDNVLKQIPVLPAGTRLDEGATYFDLKHPEHGEFTGMNNRLTGADEAIVAKSMVDYELWNHLIGVKDVYRLGRFATREDVANEPT